MSSPTPPSLDPVAVSVALFAAWMGPTLSYIIGAYFVIILSAAAGAGWALQRRPKSGTWAAILFVCLTITTSTLTTVGVASLVHNWLHLPELAQNFLLPTTALFVSAVGTDWPQLIRWLGDTLVSLVGVLKGGGGSGYRPYTSPSRTRPADDQNTGAIGDE